MKDLILTKEKVWLVKSSSRILGPYFHSEVVQGLQSRKISILDEVKTHNSRWQYIRENPFYLEIVKTLRFAQDESNEATSITKTANLGATVTKTATEIENGTMTHKIDVHADDLTQTPVYSETLNIKDVTPLRDENVESSSGFDPAKKFGALSDVRFQKEVQKKSNFFVFLIIGFFVLLASGMYIINLKNNRNKDRSFDFLIMTSNRLSSLGLYDKALTAFNQAVQIKKPNQEEYIKIAPLKLLLEKDTGASKSIIEDVIKNNKFDIISEVDANLYLGKSYLIEGNRSKAEEYFTKAHNLEFNNSYSILNQAIFNYLKGSFDSIGIKNYDFPIDLKPLRFVLMSLDSRMDLADLNSITERWKNYIDEKAYFREEQYVYFLNSRVKLNKNNLDSELEKLFSDYLVINPIFIKNLKIIWSLFDWDNLLPQCNQIANQSANETNKKLFISLCYLRSGQTEKAQQLISEVSKINPQNKFLKLMYAYLFYKIGSSNDALTYLKNIDMENFVTVNLLNGYICIQSQDYNCAHQKFNKVLQTHPNNYEAIYGEALTLYKEGKEDSSKIFLNKAIDLEPKMTNAVELREQLESGN